MCSPKQGTYCAKKNNTSFSKTREVVKLEARGGGDGAGVRRQTEASKILRGLKARPGPAAGRLLTSAAPCRAAESELWSAPAPDRR